MVERLEESISKRHCGSIEELKIKVNDSKGKQDRGGGYRGNECEDLKLAICPGCDSGCHE